jgi:hypothetical protein
MEKRDYLLRQIEALGRILSRLRELDLGTANALDPSTLLMLLGSPVLDARRAFTVGMLLHLDALRARTDGDEGRAARSENNALAVLQAAKPMLDGERAALAEQLIEEIRATRPTTA